MGFFALLDTAGINDSALQVTGRDYSAILGWWKFYYKFKRYAFLRIVICRMSGWIL